MKAIVSLNDEQRTALIAALNKGLAEYQMFYQNLRGFHWNIKGRHFFELHVQFETWYNDAAIQIDALAERILTLGGTPKHSFADYIESSDIKSVTGLTSGDDMMQVIYDNHNALLSRLIGILDLAGEAGDEGTGDLITPMVSALEKTNWMVAAWLNK